MYFIWYTVQAKFLTLILSYLSTECFNSQGVFCVVFTLKIPFIPWFYILFIFKGCGIKSEIQIFLIPKLYLQLKYTIFIYWCNRCIATNYLACGPMLCTAVRGLHITYILSYQNNHTYLLHTSV